LTTPNQEFNQALGLHASKMRDPDHKFEWTRQEFQNWWVHQILKLAHTLIPNEEKKKKMIGPTGVRFKHLKQGIL
jgi:hypothetical protein